MKDRRKLISVTSFFFVFVFAGCANAPTRLLSSSYSISAANQNISSCMPLNNSGIPVDPNIKNTHIIYYNDSIQGGSDIGQISSVSVKDGTSKVLISSPNFRTLGLAFLRDSYHYIFIGDTEIWLSDLSGAAPKEYSSADNFIDQFLPYTPIWNLLAYVNKIPSATDWESGILDSPDNKESAVWQSGASALIIRNRNSNEVKVIDTGNLDTIDGVWSPDGKEFIFSYYQNNENYYSQVLSVDADGTDLHPLTEKYIGAVLGTPHWSPDGQKIAFVRDVLLDRYLTTLDLSTNQEKSFKVSPSWNYPILPHNEIVWSPDSRWVLYVSVAGHLGIEALNLDTGDIFCVTNNSQNSTIEMMDWR
jgi:WD40-like Beta Propeller Repeat